jgi:hypothetical protein
MSGNKASEKPSKSKSSKPSKAFNETLLADNLLESDFAEGVKRGVNDFIKSTNSTFGSGLHGSSDVTNLTHKMIKNLTDNINNSFENNLGLSKECLKCKTASDFIEIHRKFFEHNYQTSVRTYTDLVHDVQQITNHTTKNASGCFGK